MMPRLAARMNRFTFPPGRRFLVVDAGSRCIKVLLVSWLLGKLRIHAHHTIGLEETISPGSEEWRRLIHDAVSELGSHSTVITVPQHMVVSQVVDLPASENRNVKQLIQEDILKLSGLTESRIVYDFGPLAPFGQYSNPYWVTHARESEILDEVDKLGELGRNTCEITSSSNALSAAYQELHSDAGNALLVDFGATGTTVVYHGQPVYATGFAIGGMMFAEQIRLHRECPFMEAEYIKNTENLLTGPDRLESMVQLTERWHEELVRILEDWLAEHPSLNITADSFPVLIAGGHASMPGLMDYLARNSVLQFQTWSDLSGAPPHLPLDQFAIAYGTAIRLFRQPQPSVSLIPGDLSTAHAEINSLHLLQAGAWMVLAILALVMAFGTWHKYTLIQEKESLLEVGRNLNSRLDQLDQLYVNLAGEYEDIRPMLGLQKQTHDGLQALSILAGHPLPVDGWHVLIGDSASYAMAEPLVPPGTNATPAVSTPGASTDRPRLTNSWIAEICLPVDPLTARLELSNFVDALRKNPLFRKVDLLAEDRRRQLVGSNVVYQGGHYAVELTLAENRLAQPVLTVTEHRTLTTDSTGTTNRAPRQFDPRTRTLTNSP